MLLLLLFWLYFLFLFVVKDEKLLSVLWMLARARGGKILIFFGVYAVFSGDDEFLLMLLDECSVLSDDGFNDEIVCNDFMFECLGVMYVCVGDLELEFSFNVVGSAFCRRMVFMCFSFGVLFFMMMVWCK